MTLVSRGGTKRRQHEEKEREQVTPTGWTLDESGKRRVAFKDEGKVVGEHEGRKRQQVRTREGPREVEVHG
eukprot:1513276-Pleurochrysis_carterae.AAC.2